MEKKLVWADMWGYSQSSIVMFISQGLLKLVVTDHVKVASWSV
jgi:hypothetical protein